MADLRLPATIHGEYAGAAKNYIASASRQPLLILAAILAVYAMLGILYESFVHPVTILSTLPSAGIGALLALLVTGTEFTIVALIAVFLLIGIVKKNAIMMIDFALDAERTRGASPHDAIFEACLLRFRPIMMTTLAALLGAAPLIFGGGEGSELRRPLGIAIAGGLIVSQILTLYTTPVVYLCLDRLRHRANARPAAGAGPRRPCRRGNDAVFLGRGVRVPLPSAGEGGPRERGRGSRRERTLSGEASHPFPWLPSPSTARRREDAGPLPA